MITWNRLAVHIWHMCQLVLSTLLCSVIPSRPRSLRKHLNGMGYESVQLIQLSVILALIQKYTMQLYSQFFYVTNQLVEYRLSAR